jgi:hypothetical protein
MRIQERNHRENTAAAAAKQKPVAVEHDTIWNNTAGEFLGMCPSRVTATFPARISALRDNPDPRLFPRSRQCPPALRIPLLHPRHLRLGSPESPSQPPTFTTKIIYVSPVYPPANLDMHHTSHRDTNPLGSSDKPFHIRSSQHELRSLSRCVSDGASECGRWACARSIYFSFSARCVRRTPLCRQTAGNKQKPNFSGHKVSLAGGLAVSDDGEA